MCPKAPNDLEEGIAMAKCNSRLNSIIQEIKPKIIALSGDKSIRAFYGANSGHEGVYGPIPFEYAIVVRIMDLGEYFAKKPTSSDEWVQENSHRILQHWKNIAKILTPHDNAP